MPIVFLFWLAVLLLIWKISRQYYRKEISSHEFVIWVVFWLVVGVGLLFIRKLDVVAQLFGVERAVDLVIYIAVAIIFYLIYRIYAKIERIERHITTLVRTHALKEDNEK